jgi:Cft2 family RNA processing exonuclease
MKKDFISKKFIAYIFFKAKLQNSSVKRNKAVSKAIENIENTGEIVFKSSESTIENLFFHYLRNLDNEKDFLFFWDKKKSFNENKKIYEIEKGVKYSLFYKTEKWVKLSSKVKSIYGKKCMKCGKENGEFHSDHIIPRSLDMSKELDINNLQVLCSKCNIDKSNLDFTDYRTELDRLKLQMFLNKNSFLSIKTEYCISDWINDNKGKTLTKERINSLLCVFSKLNNKVS